MTCGKVTEHILNYFIIFSFLTLTGQVTALALKSPNQSQVVILLVPPVFPGPGGRGRIYRSSSELEISLYFRGIIAVISPSLLLQWVVKLIFFGSQVTSLAFYLSSIHTMKPGILVFCHLPSKLDF